MMPCNRCPNRPMGCFPECLFPPASWSSTDSTGAAPEWVMEHEREMDKRAALYARQLEINANRMFTD